MTALLNAAALAERAMRLPAPIIEFCTGRAAASLARHFRPSENLFAFGERLVLLAGATICALYVEGRLTSDEQGDALLDDYLRTLVFPPGDDIREYERGIACSLIRRAHHVRVIAPDEGPLDDAALTDFIGGRRPQGAGNEFRRQLDRSYEERLAALLDQLAFLEHLDVGPSGAHFRTQAFDAMPFIGWEDDGIVVFERVVHGHEMEAPRIRASARREPDPTPTWVLPLDQRARLSKLAQRLGSVAVWLGPDSGPDSEPISRSITVLFADSHPAMNRLAERLFDKSHFETKQRLWVAPHLGVGSGPAAKEDPFELDRLARDKVTVMNIIIRQCLERDPVTVLETFFAAEPEDKEQYLKELIQVPGKSAAMLAEIEGKVHAYRSRLDAFYCSQDQRGALDQQTERFRAREFALHIIQTLGFVLAPPADQDDIADFQHRADAFYRYLVNEPTEPARVFMGLLHCCNSAETILRFLIVFYEAVKRYNRDLPTGISDADARDLTLIDDEVAGLGFGRAIGRFEKLGKDSRLAEVLQRELGRQHLWSPGSESAPFRALRALNDWRPDNVHELPKGRPINQQAAARLVNGFDHFLQWLTEPESSHERRSRGRIYPAILSLSVLSQNACGVTSIRYVLKEARRNSEYPITLYTQQPVSVTHGAFFGLPHYVKTMDDLWLFPLLIPVGALPLHSRNSSSYTAADDRPKGQR